jgi:predicted AAA+ superfamily ATPase
VARRSITIEANPLSFREFLELKHGISIPKSVSQAILKEFMNGSVPLKEFAQAYAAAGLKNLAGLFEDYLHEDMPLSLKTSREEYYEGMKSVVKKIIYEDFPKYGSLDSKLLQKAEQLLFFLSKIPCDAVRLESLSNHLEISKETVSKILLLMEQSLLIKGVEAYGRRKAVKQPRKWLFTSTSIRHALAKNLGAETDLIGNKREDAAFAHLARVFGKDSIRYSHEADFIVPEKKLAFEVGNKKFERKPKNFNTFTLTSSQEIDGNKIPIHLALLAF